jgi:hypothetical protein
MGIAAILRGGKHVDNGWIAEYSPLRVWRARAWFIVTVTAWLSFVVAAWAAFVWPDLRTLVFAGIWLTVALVVGAVTTPTPEQKGNTGE